LLDAVEARLLIEPSTSSCDVTLSREVASAHRVVRLDTAAPAHGHPSIGLWEVVLVEPKTELGCVD